MSRKEHNIRRKLAKREMYEAELEAELRRALHAYTEREAQEVIDRELRENEQQNIYKSHSDRACFTPDHPNHNTYTHKNI